MYSVNVRSKFVITLLCLIGIYSSSIVFAINLDGLLGEKYMAAKGIDSVFGGKSKVTNIFSSALTLVKNDEVSAIYNGVDSIMKIHPEFGSCSVKKSDVINILYDANFNFRVGVEQTVLNKSKKKVTMPTEGDIKRSYKAIIRCWAWDTDTNTPVQYEDARNLLNSQYAKYAGNSFDMNTMKNPHYGSDLFENGSIDDSDYDLLIDIQKIGQKLFSSFTTPLQTLFYELPKKSAGGGVNIGGGLSSNSLPPGNSNFTIVAGTDAVNADNAGKVFIISDDTIIVKNPTEESVNAGNANSNQTNDQGINDFINGANTSLNVPSNGYSIGGNLCTSGVAADLPISKTATLSTDDYQDLIDLSLNNISSVYEIPNPAKPVEVTENGVTKIVYPSGTSNQWAAQAIDSIGGECAQACNSFSDLGEKADCEMKCAESCTDKCNNSGLGAFDKSYCVSQCLCTEVSGPVGEKWKGMEDIYRIKFCTVPVQNDKVSGGKKVYSIYDIFAEIKAILSALLNSGENVKRTKPKEHFDTALSEIKFSDIISFQISFAKRALFANKSESTIKKEEKQKDDKNQAAIKGIGVPNINKYVLIADIAANKALKQKYANLDDQNKKIEELKQLEEKSKIAMTNVVSTAQSKRIASLNDKVLNFVMGNYAFWEQMYIFLKDINDQAIILNDIINRKG